MKEQGARPAGEVGIWLVKVYLGKKGDKCESIARCLAYKERRSGE